MRSRLKKKSLGHSNVTKKTFHDVAMFWFTLLHNHISSIVISFYKKNLLLGRLNISFCICPSVFLFLLPHNSKTTRRYFLKHHVSLFG